MQPHHLKGKGERARSVFLRGLIGSSKPTAPGSEGAVEPAQVQVTPPPQPQAASAPYDLRTFDRSQLADEPRVERPTKERQTARQDGEIVDLESNSPQLEALKALFDDLGTPVMVVVIGAAARIALRFVGDSRLVIICVMTAVILAAFTSFVIYPHKKRLPLHIILSLVGFLWLGSFL